MCVILRVQRYEKKPTHTYYYRENAYFCSCFLKMKCMSNMPPVTKNLLIINLLVFLATLALRGYDVSLSQYFGLHFAAASDFRIYQLVTYMFLHANIEHIFFNMFALWMFGRVMEQVFGSQRFLTYYLVCGIGAGLMQEIAQTIQYFVMDLHQYSGATVEAYLNSWTTVGASGAVYGILLSFGYMFPNQKMFIIPIPFPIKAKYFVAGYAAIELFSVMSRSNDGVAHMAHLGGMLFGWLLLVYWRKPRRNVLDELRQWWQQRQLKSQDNYNRNAGCGGFRSDEMEYNARRQARQQEIDRILQKVKQYGYGSLTEDEKRKLFDASKE